MVHLIIKDHQPFKQLPPLQQFQLQEVVLARSLRNQLREQNVGLSYFHRSDTLGYHFDLCIGQMEQFYESLGTYIHHIYDSIPI